MLLAVSCIGLTGCVKEDTEAPTSDKVMTGEVTEITTQSAVLAGKVNMDIKDYNSVEFGMMVSDNLQDMNNRKGNKVWGKTLIGKDYTIRIDGLTDNTKYYYCAFVFLNETQYEFSTIKNFTTQEEKVVKNAAFSVSETKQVRFSPGNLQYTCSTGVWSFAEHQYDMLGTDNVSDGAEQIDSDLGYYYKEGSALADKIDLFGWSGSTGRVKWGIGTSTDCDDYSGDFADWGRNIGDGKTWYTLTSGEWEYLLRNRPYAYDLMGIARIKLNSSDYVNGLILLPDNWICPPDVTFQNGFSDMTSIWAYANHQTLTLIDWQKLEAAGAVFLPASGGRFRADVNDVQCDGLYWSATPYDSGYAGFMRFYSREVGSLNYRPTRDGQAVRLVQDLIK